MNRKALLIAGVAVALTSCGASARRGTQDAPIGATDNTPPVVILNFPDGYPNIAFKCNGHDGIYTLRRDYQPVVVVPKDDNCYRETP